MRLFTQTGAALLFILLLLNVAGHLEWAEAKDRYDHCLAVFGDFTHEETTPAQFCKERSGYEGGE